MTRTEESRYQLFSFSLVVIVGFAILEAFFQILYTIVPDSDVGLPPFLDFLVIVGISVFWYRQSVGIRPSTIDLNLFAAAAALGAFSVRMGLVFLYLWEGGIPITPAVMLLSAGLDESMVTAILSVPYLFATLIFAVVTLDMAVVAIIAAVMTRNLPQY